MKSGKYGLPGRRVEKSRIFFGNPLDFSGGGRVEPFEAESKGGYQGHMGLLSEKPVPRESQFRQGCR